MSREFVTTTLVLIGIAVGVALLVYAAVYVGGSRRTKRYRPGRPFDFTPVWFLSAPEQQARAGLVSGATGGRELTAAPSNGASRVVRPGETGGASDRW